MEQAARELLKKYFSADAVVIAALRSARKNRRAASRACLSCGKRKLRKVSRKSKIAEAIRCALTRRKALERFLTDGRIEIGSNIVERAIRAAYLPAARAVDELGRPWPHFCKRPK
ncbi:IS66 family transposase [Mesorhizobium captivum]|uniref:IS66 family transposase n=1 Tax=Mesorhizobium captivum TaxID=3072319 RepID=UPI003D6C04B9